MRTPCRPNATPQTLGELFVRPEATRREGGLEETAAVLQMAIVPIPPGKVLRLLTLLSLPLRLWVVERRLLRTGVVVAGRYGCYPDAVCPALVFQFGSSAARYTHRYLLPSRSRGLVRRTLSAWAGCDPSVGAVVIVGFQS